MGARWEDAGVFRVLFAGLVQVRASLHNGSKQLNWKWFIEQNQWEQKDD